MKSKISSLLVSGKQYIHALPNLTGREHDKRVFMALALMFALSMFVVGRWSSPTPVLMQQTIAGLKLEIIQQQHLLDQLSRDQEANVNALAARLAELKAASTRLDALGQRLVQLGQLDPEEFDFDQPPPVGGPELLISDGQSNVVDVSQAITRLSALLSSQMTRLDALQLLLLDRNLENERTPAGWPVSSGWISSRFGERNDPFTGKRTQHNGLDFAGIKGSEVLGVARGVVIWSGTKQGYGETLEIDHGNGYVTRYAHNDELLVSAGDRVVAGQNVAKMGSSGRASSPHVHFEVLYKGNAVNPGQFVKQII
jgi:murein DD-endopeptidase MepM/ murein hydrolase activator NlpD